VLIDQKLEKPMRALFCKLDVDSYQFFKLKAKFRPVLAQQRPSKHLAVLEMSRGIGTSCCCLIDTNRESSLKVVL